MPDHTKAERARAAIKAAFKKTEAASKKRAAARKRKANKPTGKRKTK